MKHKCEENCEGADVCGQSNFVPPVMKPQQGEVVHMSEREQQWWTFAYEVANHLRDYTVPQYGDVGEDAITDYSTQDCVTQVEKYAKRFGTQSREGQQELDFLKIAHYVQCAWEKYEPEEIVSVGVRGRLVEANGLEDQLLGEDENYILDCLVTDQDGTVYHFWKEKEQ